MEPYEPYSANTRPCVFCAPRLFPAAVLGRGWMHLLTAMTDESRAGYCILLPACVWPCTIHRIGFVRLRSWGHRGRSQAPANGAHASPNACAIEHLITRHAPSLPNVVSRSFCAKPYRLRRAGPKGSFRFASRTSHDHLKHTQSLWAVLTARRSAAVGTGSGTPRTLEPSLTTLALMFLTAAANVLRRAAPQFTTS